MRPDQIERLGDALSSAFDQFTLNQLVVTRINPLGLSAYTSIYLALPIQATNLIVQANAQDFTPELVNAARELRPKNDAFLELADELSLTAFGRSEPQRRSDLQRTIRAKNVFNNLFLFRSRLTEIEFQVCRIEVPVTKATGETALMTGTGFLTGPDLVMTNYHVIEPLLHEVDEWTGKPADVRARFDYKKLSAKSVNDGVTYELAEPWLVDSSPYESAEEPKGEELDYAILRLARSAGDEAVGGWPAGATPPKRGFMKLKTTGEAFAPDSPLVIVQHPSGDPLSIAFDTDSVIRLNDGKTRVRYRTNTEHGSSGSPCFNLKLELVALHHAGDPEYDHPPEYNAGIPIDVIVALLAQRNINI
ncbi:MAG TPA: trypsin-like peptidase domain-containing protein [Thermoanaerobaculia bacterium]|nr:trypsin-like peptidase domain-containing protein [Thermoanaerobaculia bacterium]